MTEPSPRCQPTSESATGYMSPFGMSRLKGYWYHRREQYSPSSPSHVFAAATPKPQEIFSTPVLDFLLNTHENITHTLSVLQHLRHGSEMGSCTIEEPSLKHLCCQYPCKGCQLQSHLPFEREVWRALRPIVSFGSRGAVSPSILSYRKKTGSSWGHRSNIINMWLSLVHLLFTCPHVLLTFL